MDLEDYVQPEIAVTAAVAAAVFSPRTRRLVRRGVVYGLGGALMAGDAVRSFSRSIGRGLQEAGTARRSQTEQQHTSPGGAEGLS
jgi:hypothetical protein